MTGMKYDFNKDRAAFAEAVGIDSGFTESDFRSKISTFAVLTFKINTQKEGVISRYKGQYVFKEGSSDQTIVPGDTWLCNLRPCNEVYYAMPLMKITPAILMGFSTELCDSIVEALWEKNRREYEGIFENRFKEAMYKRVTEEISAEKEAETESLKQRITELERDLEASRFALDDASGGDLERDEIELSSDPEPPVEEARQDGIREQAVRYHVVTDDYRPPIPETFASTQSEPIYKSIENQMNPARAIRIKVTHVSDKLLYSEVFPNGRCFVHVSPNMKFLLIRADTEGPVYCINHHIRLNDLNRIIPFTEESELVAEYSPKYRGILVYINV